jgi:histidyl-tRNA synthetase
MKLVEQRFIDTIRAEFERFGFTPIETPAVERFDILDAKAGIGRQIYQVIRPAEDGGSSTGSGSDGELGLHFDLTVPLARYVVQHAHELQFPFRRYQIQKVWRGERAQRGRFREFYQCDIDIVGREKLDVLYDAEVPCVLASIFGRLELPPFAIHISNRRILSDVFAAFGHGDRSGDLLRIVDRFHKVGAERVARDLVHDGLSAAQADAVMALIAAGTVDEARAVAAGAGTKSDAFDDLEVVMRSADQLGMPPGRLQLDLSIARGLDYYTGTVFETFVTDHVSWGSICSGGRYDDLASQFGSKTSFPGTGISLGLTRLLDLLRSEGLVAEGASTPSQAMVLVLERDHLPDYLGYARTLREAGIATEVHFQPAKLAKQLAYASSKGIPCVVIAGEDELARHEVVVRDMRSREQHSVGVDRLAETVMSHLRSD